MTDEPTHIATAAAALDDPYAALSQHLHGDGDAPTAGGRLIAASPTLAADTLRLLDEIERLKEEVEQLREAAKPFSDAMQYIDPEDQDDYAPSWAQFFTIADFRRITAALAEGGPDDR